MNWSPFDWYDTSTWPPANTMLLWQAGDFETYYFVGEFWIDENKVPSIYTSYAKGIIPRGHPSIGNVTHWVLIVPADR